MKVLRLVSALSRSCHPAPVVAVTAFAVTLAATAGNPAGTCALLGTAVLTGQLSIGWSNDRLDLDRDRRAGRGDKPLATGELSATTADVAVAVALAATIAFSLSLGWRAGLLHLAAVACGWAYNLKLKATRWSWAPYAAAFSALPAIATLALPAHPAPAAWVVGAAALLGVSANLTNALPDLADDRLTGIDGLPHRLGAKASLRLAGLLLLGATLLAALGPRGGVAPLGWAAVTVSVLAAVTATALADRLTDGKAPFYGLVVVVSLDLALIVTVGHQLH